jgi:drug/metabolite transporter (DMT)-like permease
VYALLALLFSLLWASAFIAVKFALLDSPPLFRLGVRFLLAGAALLAVALLRGRRLPASGREWGRLAALGLLNYAVYLGMSSIALRTVSAGMGAVLASTTPVLLAGAAAVVLKERLGPLKLAGLALAFGCVALVMSSRIGSGNQPLGMALLLLANAVLVVGTVLFKRWMPRHDLLVLNGAQLLVAGVALLVPSALLEPVAGVRWTPAFLAAIAYLVVAVSWGAMLIWFTLLRSGDASRASAFLFLNPIFGLVLGGALLGEPLGPADLAGGLGVALGIYLVQSAR